VNTTTGSGAMPAGAAAGLADEFVAALQRGDLEGAFRAVSPAARVVIHPTGQAGGPEIAREFFREALGAFPDLMLTVTRRTACADGRVVVELTFEGTQAADFLGAINQEKHLDVEQAWLLATQDGLITAITGYWDQNKLYRRLAVKRLDRIAIA
jgi:ketosteroid isomerase-like protein